MHARCIYMVHPRCIVYGWWWRIHMHRACTMHMHHYFICNNEEHLHSTTYLYLNFSRISWDKLFVDKLDVISWQKMQIHRTLSRFFMNLLRLAFCWHMSVFVDMPVFVDTFSAFWKCNKNRHGLYINSIFFGHIELNPFLSVSSLSKCSNGMYLFRFWIFVRVSRLI